MSNTRGASSVVAGVGGVIALGACMGLLMLNPGGLLLGAAGLAYLIVAALKRGVRRPWLLGVALGFAFASLVYAGLAVSWQFAGAPSTGSGSGGP